MLRPDGGTRKLGGGFRATGGPVIAYEEGQITHDEEVAFFEHLVETGVCWQLPGHYQRVGATLIEAGLIKPAEQTKLDSNN